MMCSQNSYMYTKKPENSRSEWHSPVLVRGMELGILKIKSDTIHHLKLKVKPCCRKLRVTRETWRGGGGWMR